MQLDPDEFADIVANAIKLAMAPLVARIAVLERREAVPGPEGKPGRDGEAGPPWDRRARRAILARMWTSL